MAGSALIGALRVSLGLDSAQFAAGAKRAQTTMQQFRRQMQVIGASLAVAVATLAVAIKGQLNAADAAGEAAQKLGVSVEDLTRLRYAAKLSGVEVSDLETGIRQLSKGMAANSPVLQKLGIAVRDTTGAMRPTAEVMQDIAQKFAEMPDGAEKTALAMQIFGKSGAALIPMLNNGRDGMRALIAEADRLGVTISQDTADAAGKFNDNLERLRAAMQGIVIQIAAALAPTLETLSQYAVDAANAFGQLPEPVRQIVSVFGSMLLVAAPLVVTIGLFSAAVAAVGAPVAAAAAGVALLVAAAVALWPVIKAAGEAVMQLGRDLVQMANDGVDYAIAKFREFVEFVKTIPAQMLEIGRNVIQGFVDGIRQRWEQVKESVTGIFSGEMTGIVVDELGIHSPSRVFRAIGRFVTEGFRLGIEDGAGGARDAAMGMASDAVDAAAAQVDQVSEIGQAVQQSWRDIARGIGAGARNIGDVLDNLKDKILGLLVERTGGAFLGALFPALFGAGGFAPLLAAAGAVVQGGRVTPFAEGGVVTRPTMFPLSTGAGLMGEAGPEAILPLKRAADGRLGVEMHGGQAVDVRVWVDDDGRLRAVAEEAARDEVGRAAPAIRGAAVGDMQARMKRSKRGWAG